MKRNAEYQLSKAISIYLRLQYPSVLFHWDLAGLNLSIVQAGMMKVIQGGRGWPDLFIAEPRGIYHGLFIEVKMEGIRLLNRKDEYATEHLKEQAQMIIELEQRGYAATFGIGFNQCKEIIDNYLSVPFVN